MKEVQVGGLMNETAVINVPTAPLFDVVEQLRESRQSCVIIVNEEKIPVGIVTERDLVRVLGELLKSDASQPRCVTEFMTSSPLVVMDTTPLFEALVLTQTHKIRHLPVVDCRGRLAGVLSYSDLAHAYEHVIEKQRILLEKEIGAKAIELQEINEQLKALSMEDALLGIGNRRSMEVDLSYTHSSAMRYKRAYSVVLYDVDCFKEYNDFYGHQAGDDALKAVANHISAEIRKSDRLYRYGGEELLLLLPETDYSGSLVVAGRILKDLHDKNIPHEKSAFARLTMSGGIGSLEEPFSSDSDWKKIVEFADKALYQAKQAGRNRIGDRQ